MQSERPVDCDVGGDVSRGGGGEKQKRRKSRNRISLTPRHQQRREHEQTGSAVHVEVRVGIRICVNVVVVVIVVVTVVWSAGVERVVGERIREDGVVFVTVIAENRRREMQNQAVVASEYDGTVRVRGKKANDYLL